MRVGKRAALSLLVICAGHLVNGVNVIWMRPTIDRQPSTECLPVLPTVFELFGWSHRRCAWCINVARIGDGDERARATHG